jgi:hypothetical protein
MGYAVSGLIGTGATMLARAITRRAMHDGTGARRLPGAAQYRQSVAVTLAWAALTGVVLALADELREQHRASVPGQ